jgi:NAD(P)-dependent dehydrogenase (short-subunit alcohol dehydrogenase family)
MTAEGARPLEGRVALVTGGSRGLGAEMARAFVQAGAAVAISSRKHSACEALASQLRDELGANTSSHACHVGHWDELTDLVDSVYERHGRLDVLVNNAGIAPLYPSLVEVTEELFDKVIGVNLKGPFRLSALVGSRMAAGTGGSIINISSVAAIRPTPNELPYAAAKAGLGALTAGFALAYGPKVRVNTIMAGPFLTDIAAAWDMETFGEMARAYPLARAGDPREIVGAALYLASDASSFTTGSVLRVDGGQGISHPGVVPGG